MTTDANGFSEARRHHLTAGEAPTVRVESFPGRPEQVRAARRFIAAVLGDDHPCHDDAVLLLSEIATNALRHTASGHPGERGGAGTFAVMVAHSPKWVRVSVLDAGSTTIPCGCRVRRNATGGRGIALVDRMAFRWGFVRETGATTVWFEVGRPQRDGTG